MACESSALAWFRSAKFGLFVHWGLYAIPAGFWKGQDCHSAAEWIMNVMHIPSEEYEKLAEQFDPKEFDADLLVQRAKSWGMQYIVFTAKHHEGFAMYHSAHPYNVVDATPCRRDLLKELADACQRHGMPLGLYYSQAQDWDDPDGFEADRDDSQKNFHRYLEQKVKPQLTELLTQYGKIALVWFDTPMAMTSEQSRELYGLVKKLQPDCLINGRLGNGLSDYMTTSDNFLPRLPYTGAWELPATLNDTWGYKKNDHNWKSPDVVLRLLLKVVSRGGNYLLNIGPTDTGAIPEDCMPTLEAVGAYVSQNKEAILETNPVPIYPYELDWAEMTCRPHKLYLHILRPIHRVDLPRVAFRASEARILADGAPLEFLNTATCEGEPNLRVFLPPEQQKCRNYCIEVTIDRETPEFMPFELP